jgi:cytoskeletal protein RodZ
MGTLGKYLRNAREARGIDLRDAAQQTRIGATYLKALEAEDFTRLPGEVFVKGFLKNYGKFLCLDESEVMRKYGELKPEISEPSAAAAAEPVVSLSAKKTPQTASIEPFLWGAGVVIVFAVIVFVFTSLPERQHQEAQGTLSSVSVDQTSAAPVTVTQAKKLYLEVYALENTWLLVRTDNSPQKKALLQKDESLIWSANERFLLSYGSAKALKLTLNGRELVLNEPGNAVVRDLPIISTGIVNRHLQPARPRRVKPKQIPVVEPVQLEPEVKEEIQGPPALVQPDPF